MAYENDNVFAKILRGELPCDKVYENDHALAFRDIQPQAPVHILVIPKGPMFRWMIFLKMQVMLRFPSFSGLSDMWLAMRVSSKQAIECWLTMAMMGTRRCRISMYMYLVDVILEVWCAAPIPEPGWFDRQVLQHGLLIST